MKHMTAAPAPGVSRAAYLDGMARMAHSVSILTTGGPAGRDGMVVTAVSSVSADLAQPCLLACVHSASRPAPLIRGNGVICLNVLAETHQLLSERFAGRHGGVNDDWFGAGAWSHLGSSAPALDGALVNFDCEISQMQEMGSHLVIFGSVLSVRMTEGRPLLYAGRDYARLL